MLPCLLPLGGREGQISPKEEEEMTVGKIPSRKKIKHKSLPGYEKKTVSMRNIQVIHRIWVITPYILLSPTLLQVSNFQVQECIKTRGFNRNLFFSSWNVHWQPCSFLFSCAYFMNIPHFQIQLTQFKAPYRSTIFHMILHIPFSRHGK